MKFYDTDSSNVEVISKKVDEVFAAMADIPYKIVSVDKQSEIIKCKKTSVEAEYLSKKEPCLLITVFEDAFDLLDDETKELVIRKGIQGVSYNIEKGTIKINNDLVANICELRHQDRYSNAKSFMDMIEAEKAAIQQIIDMRKAEQKKQA